MVEEECCYWVGLGWLGFIMKKRGGTGAEHRARQEEFGSLIRIKRLAREQED